MHHGLDVTGNQQRKMCCKLQCCRLITWALKIWCTVGWIDCGKTSWKEEGRSVFFNGMTATVTRAFIVNAAVFSVYEFLLKAMQDQEQTPQMAETQAIVEARH